jgi:hypothetical protein
MHFKADITIDQDWNKIRKIYSVIVDKMNNDQIDSFYYIEERGGTQYNLGSFGSLVYGDGLSPDWGAWGGPLLESSLGWVQQARDYFQGLNFHGMIFSVTEHPVDLHIDGRPPEEKHLNECKINYIVETQDVSAKTYVYNQDSPDIFEWYPSIPGHAYLLDTSNPHEVQASGHREVLQFKFFNTFDEVKNFLLQAKPVHFSTKC